MAEWSWSSAFISSEWGPLTVYLNTSATSVPIKVNGPTFSYASPTIKVKTTKGKDCYPMRYQLWLYSGNTYIYYGYTSYVNQNAYGQFSAKSVSGQTSTLFNKSNKTQRTVSRAYALTKEDLYGYWKENPSSINDYIGRSTKLTVFTVSLTLDVPPTFYKDPIEYDTNFGDPYAGLTTASVDISNLTAYYDGYITRAVLKVGNQESEPLVGDDTNILSEGTLSILLNAVGTFTPTITVTDSRGQTKTEALEAITVKGYTAPQVSINEVLRTDENGLGNDEGKCAVVTATFTWTSAITDLDEPTLVATELDDTLVPTETKWYTDRALQNEITDWSEVSNMPVYAFIGNSNTPPDPFDTQDSYNITITPNDDMGAGTPATATLGAAFYTMDFLAGGHGIAFGMPSSQEGFFCNMDAYFKDGANFIRALHDFMRPVGSTYPTVDPNFNPNVTWGGTWEKLPEGYILLSGSDGTGAGDTYVVGEDATTDSGYKEYGENTHTLTVDEMPSHNHTIAHTHHLSNAGMHFLGMNYNTTGVGAGETQVATGSSGRYALTCSKSNVDFVALQATGSPSNANSGDKGNGQALEIMQKSIAVYWWIRTA